jgi:hypothetical protein
MRSALVAVLSVTACTGSITMDDDDDPIDPPTPTVAVIVRDGQRPVADVNVIFQASDHSVIADLRTGADGRATADLPAGGNVTVIRTYPLPTTPDEPPRPARVYTYVGVKGGDALQVTGELDMKSGTPNAINVKVPTTAAGTVKIVTPCGSGEGTAPTIPMTVVGCALEVPFYVTDGNGQAFVMRTQVSENVDLSAGVLTDSLDATATATNPQPDISTITVEKRLQADAYQLFSTGAKRIDQTPQTVTLPDLQGIEQVTVAALTRTTGGTQIVTTREPYVVEPTIVDAGVARIPYTSKVTYAPTGVSWVEDGTGTADFVVATLTVSRPDQTSATGKLDFVRTIVAPHTSQNLTLPQLPVAQFNLTADDTITGTLGIVAMTGGYDAARATVFAHRSISDIAPMNGSATISYSGTAPR